MVCWGHAALKGIKKTGGIMHTNESASTSQNHYEKFIDSEISSDGDFRIFSQKDLILMVVELM